MEKRIRGAIEDNLKRKRQKKYCSAKELLNIECSKKIIKAHTISKSSSLSTIMDKNNEVIGSDLSFGKLIENNGLLGLRKIGVNDASTFTGFCSEHDKLLFSRIEDEEVLPDLEQIFLFSYRGLCREIYAKGNQKNSGLQKSILNNSNLIKPSIEEYDFWEKNILTYEGYASFSFNELIETQAKMHTMWEQKNFNDMEAFIIELSSSSQILSSGTFIPNISFFNEKIFDLNDLSVKIHHMFFNVINSINKGYIIFSWIKEERNEFYYKFIKSFLDIRTNKKKEDALVRLVFSFFENTYFSPVWWNSLNEKQKEEINTKRQEIFEHNLASVNAKNYNAFKILKYSYFNEKDYK
ncbi:cytoplasmic protein [Actinobacillus pleuropneumoniae]|uniref:cytoplasmic protein n=1 Tax=Actinobacillus pleuropneumoniae TaxID=715 RepID=UPI003B01EC87